MLKRKYSLERNLMHTIIQISVISDQGTVFTNDKLEEAFQHFADVGEKYTRFKPESELSKLNSAPKGKPYKVSKGLFSLIKRALEIAKLSDGFFDPTIIDILEAYGYGANAEFNKLNNPELMHEISTLLLTRKTWHTIKLDEANSTITLSPNQRLDLGGIAKGYAIDLAHDSLLKDFDCFLINAGGDIRVHGLKEDGTPWIVALEKAPQFITNSTANIWAKIELHNMALAASGAWSRKIKFFHHLINPKTGLPVEETAQVFTIAKTAMEADVWATTLFMMGKDGIAIAEQNNITAFVIDSSGKQYPQSFK